MEEENKKRGFILPTYPPKSIPTPSIKSTGGKPLSQEVEDSIIGRTATLQNGYIIKGIKVLEAERDKLKEEKEDACVKAAQLTIDFESEVARLTAENKQLEKKLKSEIKDADHQSDMRNHYEKEWRKAESRVAELTTENEKLKKREELRKSEYAKKYVVGSNALKYRAESADARLGVAQKSLKIITERANARADAVSKTKTGMKLTEEQALRWIWATATEALGGAVDAGETPK